MSDTETETVELTGDDPGGEDRPWVVGLPGMLRQGGRGLLFGATGEGKSWAALRAAEQVVRAGGIVRYLDYENGRKRTRERLRFLEQPEHPPAAALDPPYAGAIEYAFNFDLRAKREDEDAWIAWLDEQLANVDLVVVDGLPLLLGLLGYNESTPSDIAQFFARYVYPMVWDKRSVLLCDNTGWDARRVRGARSKIDMSEVAYRVTGGKTCKPDTTGTVHLKIVRWRDGDEEPHLTMEAGAGIYTDLAPPPATGTARSVDREEVWHDATVAALVEEEAPLSKNALTTRLRDGGLKFNTQDYKAAIRGWIEDADDEVGLDGKGMVVLLTEEAE